MDEGNLLHSIRLGPQLFGCAVLNRSGLGMQEAFSQGIPADGQSAPAAQGGGYSGRKDHRPAPVPWRAGSHPRLLCPAQEGGELKVLGALLVEL